MANPTLKELEMRRIEIALVANKYTHIYFFKKKFNVTVGFSNPVNREIDRFLVRDSPIPEEIGSDHVRCTCTIMVQYNAAVYGIQCSYAGRYIISMPRTFLLGLLQCVYERVASY